MSQQRRTFIACVFSFLFLTLSFRVESQYLLADFRDDKQELVLNEAHFKKEGLCEKPLLYTIVGGSYGSRKSALLNSLGRLLKVPNSEFKSGFDDAISTGGINASDSNDWGLIFLDLMVLKDDPTGAKATNLESDKVDRMLSLLVAPLTNIVIYSIRDDDLKWLKMFSQFIETVSIPVYKRTPKPLLILTLHSNKHRIVNVDDMLENVIPVEIKTKFSDVKLVFMNEDEGEEEKKLLQENNFHPEKIPSYWSSMTTIGNIVKAHAETISNDGRWTGCEANEIMKKTLDQINQQQSIDSIDTFPIYKSLVSQRIRKAVNASCERLSEEVQELIEKSPKSGINVWFLNKEKFEKARELVRQQFIQYESEENLKETVYTALMQFDILYSSNMRKLKDSIDEESRARAILKSEIDTFIKMNNLTGYPVEVNCNLRKEIQAAISRYYEKDPSARVDWRTWQDHTQNLLYKIHAENELIRINRRNYLTNLNRTYYEYVPHPRKLCANGEKEFKLYFNSRLPVYFKTDVRRYLHHVHAELDIDGDEVCAGAFILQGKPKENLVCEQRSACCSNGQHKITQLYYDSSVAELRIRVKLENWEEKECQNFIELRGVRLTIQQQAIIDEPGLAKPYDRFVDKC
eukprot:gene16113-18205_t